MWYLDLLEIGDSVMADKGFNISYDVFTRGCTLNIPQFVRNNTMSKHNVIGTRKIASVSVHVERAIGRIKNVLCGTIPLSIASHGDSIWFIYCALTLFHNPQFLIFSLNSLNHKITLSIT